MPLALRTTLTTGLLLAGLVWNCRRSVPADTALDRVAARFRADVAALDSAAVRLERLTIAGADSTALRAAFGQARLRWKATEWLAEYYFPETSRHINGAPLDEVEAEDSKIEPPAGLQVVEEYLYPTFDEAARPDLRREVAALRAGVTRLHRVSEANQLTEQQLFDALRLEVFRIVTLGITGFDAPGSQTALPEAAAALASLEGYLPLLASTEPPGYTPLLARLRQAQEYLHRAAGVPEAFARFDRLAFITEYANPISSALLDVQRARGIASFDEARLLRADARTLFDSAAFNPDVFMAFGDLRSTPAKVALGRRLFYDPVLSGNGRRSCASCHQPERGFADGLARPAALTGTGTLARNTPTLLNAAFQAAQFWDGRVAYLEDQATDVIQNRDEMHGSLDAAVRALGAQPAYARAFAEAFPEKGLTELSLRNALASYVRSLTSFDTPVDRYLRGDQKALRADEKRGFNLFTGKAKCATCHFLPLFNGTVPPHYQKTETEVLGTPDRAGWTALRLDADRGRAVLGEFEPWQRAFKTPTVRNVAQTAPYMHNGVYRTLEEVVEFYDRGGGTGLGLDVPNQTLPAEPLRLTKQEKADLVRFMQALSENARPGALQEARR
jgi:cytochrome c peroxidase